MARSLPSLPIILAALPLLLTSCKKEEPDYGFSVNNATTFDVTMKNRVDGTSADVPAGQTKSIKTTTTAGLYDISSPQTTQRFGMNETSTDHYQLYTYGADLEYRISGSAATADLTYQNSMGTTSQRQNTALPASLSFPVFNGGYVYISAQNGASTGTITVSIYRRGQLFSTNTASGSYAIATASGTF